MPPDYPDYPGHWLIARYFDDYVDHFGFRDLITFRTEVTDVRPAPGGRSPAPGQTGSGSGWDVSTDDGETRRYRAVMVANGHHWSPRWPEPPFPGQDDYEGEQVHVHDYKEPDLLAGKRVLVLGIGNSACDIAVESSRNADATFLAMRRGAYVIPKYLFGRPTDEMGSAWITRLPFALQRAYAGLLIGIAQGKMTDYGLPEPDHKLGEAHPTISSDLLPRIGHGDIAVKPNIERFAGGRTVRFTDGSEEEIDLVVWCTGYRIAFPFFDRAFLDPSDDNRIPLYRRVVHPEHPGLYFIGLVQPLGAIMPLAEAQSEWIADVLEGKVQLPSPAAMRRVIEREDARMAKRYVASKRHTIQVDFMPYLRTIARERRVGKGRDLLDRVRAGRSHELQLGRPG
jgi:cation diffusion facilitator CzcD-associated flavoprotein CzcO